MIVFVCVVPFFIRRSNDFGGAQVYRMLIAEIMFEIVFDVPPERSAWEDAHRRGDTNLDRLRNRIQW